ncbi:hypothetical protein JD844_028822 [Phrynosoma platyrhinos]|uniref:ethanolamine kinase n=1 Tax=Phrynosoma platyrhinos TaxID=52577 RepID=A0ABQ7SIG9_PHRPL|nr:hypothetical protein JD844_028822 [Phrynosoma platyrhinos]
MANYIHVPPGSPEVPKLDILVSETEPFSGGGGGGGYRYGALQLLSRLRPDWKPEEVTLKVFTDGITNKLIGCYKGEEMDDVVLVRIYGNKTELLVDREEEVKSFRVLQAHGCAPKLYCTFSNGLCYEFMQGEALDPEHVCNPEIFRLIARQLAKIHAIHAHNGWIPKSNLWLKMGKYFSLIPTEFVDKDLHKRYVDATEEFFMVKYLERYFPRLCFYPADEVHRLGDVQFIDYEYSGYNYLAYDIGNHFNEFAAHSNSLNTQASHFFWGLWALIQAKYSTIDFDFLGYAIVRFNQYFKMKNEVMMLKLPE